MKRAFIAPLWATLASLLLLLVHSPVTTMAQEYTFTSSLSDGLRPDYSGTSFARNTTVGLASGVFIMAYRDTTVGPVAMNLSAQLAADPDYLYKGYVHNSDFYLIGNGTKTLYVHNPATWSYAAPFLVGAASFVKSTRVNGRDQYTVHWRSSAGKLSEWGFVANEPLNCTDTANPWKCPDVVLSGDTSLADMTVNQNKYLALDDVLWTYFKRTGVSVIQDIVPSLIKISSINEVMYTLPLNVFPAYGKFNRTNFEMLNVTMPPPYSSGFWGVDPLSKYTFDEAERLAVELKNKGAKNPLMFPPIWGASFKMLTMFAAPFGGSVLTPQRKCGLDAATMGLALNRTLLKWRDMGLMEWNIKSNNPNITVEQWIKAPPKDNIMDEPEIDFVNPTEHSGIDFSGYGAPGYGQGIEKCLNPNNYFFGGSLLIGIGSGAKDPNLAFEFIMSMFSKPEIAVANNAPGFKKHFNEPEMQSIDGSITKTIVTNMAAQSFPAGNFPDFGLLDNFPQLNIGLYEIWFKNLSHDFVFKRVCKGCNERDWVPTLTPCDPSTIQQSIQFEWAPNRLEVTCRTDRNTLYQGSKPLPPNIPNVAFCTYVPAGNVGVRALYVVSLILMSLLILTAIIVLINSKHLAIKSSSMLFSQTILIGGILCFASIAMSVGDPNPLTCEVNVWFLGLGPIFIFGSFTVKLFRINFIFNKKAKINQGNAAIKDYGLLMQLGMYILIQIICLLIWQILQVDNSSLLTEQSLTITGFTQKFTQVSCRPHSMIGSALVIGTAAVIIIISVYFAYTTRNVPDRFNESKFIWMAVLAGGIISIIVAPTLTILSNNYQIFIVKSIGIILATSVACFGYIVPKILQVYGFLSVNEAATVMQTSGGNSATRATGSVSKQGTGTHHTTEVIKSNHDTGLQSANSK
ncbi:Metabotropic glutamate receptor 3 [Chytridiales sp. JEL 0842]|nr:Metabotropic glutamate receptor 3 [Chytridiales sp. JEL 0842]